MYYLKLKIYAGFRNTSKDTKRRLILTVIYNDRSLCYAGCFKFVCWCCSPYGGCPSVNVH